MFQGATEACFSLSEAESLSLSGMLAPLTIDGSHSHSPRNLQTYKNSTYNLGIYTPSDVCHRFSRASRVCSEPSYVMGCCLAVS